MGGWGVNNKLKGWQRKAMRKTAWLEPPFADGPKPLLFVQLANPVLAIPYSALAGYGDVFVHYTTSIANKHKLLASEYVNEQQAQLTKQQTVESEWELA